MSDGNGRRERLNRITESVIASAMQVHGTLGPGLLESAYEACLAYELQERGFSVEQQKLLSLSYKQLRVEAAYRIDLLIDDSVIVEIKAVEALLPIHQAQLLSYLKLANCKVGLLINFNVQALRSGIRRVVNGF